MEKLHSYQGWIGRFHEWRQSVGERFTNWRQENPETVIELLKKQVANRTTERENADYSHVYRSLSYLIFFLIFHFHWISKFLPFKQGQFSKHETKK